MGFRKYIGTKLINAVECDYFTFYINKYGKESFDNMTKKTNRENSLGYMVEYPPDNYRSWSPKDRFDEAYKTYNKITYEMAMYMSKRGFYVGREKWDGDYLRISGRQIKKCLVGSINHLWIDYIPLNEDILTDDWKVMEVNDG